MINDKDKKILQQYPDPEKAANFERSRSILITSVNDLDVLQRDAEPADKAIINAAIGERLREYGYLISDSTQEDVDHCRATGGFRNG